ncbi:hypothetical protein A4A49_12964 [Nicotiana attenuata]|uniref:Uncharacterized protein n=1 Tax=Nicotiana attenuata TaxID=49451 RepID=A0A314KM73_NICAT|nr:hypothetical protein A4A49_12964 [Nicotiana attenuata]
MASGTNAELRQRVEQLEALVGQALEVRADSSILARMARLEADYAMRHETTLVEMALSHSISSPYKYEDSYGHNLDSSWDAYYYYNLNGSEVRQPSQGENDSLEELVYKFINKPVERFTKDDEDINNLTMQVNQLVSTLSGSSLRCDGEYMEEIPCENEPTQEDEHPQRELFTIQEDSDSTKMIENMAVAECEAMEDEFKPPSTFPPLQHVVEKNEKQMVLDILEEYSLDLSSLFSYSNLDHVDYIFGDLREYVWIDPVKECREQVEDDHERAIHRSR